MKKALNTTILPRYGFHFAETDFNTFVFSGQVPFNEAKVDGKQPKLRNADQLKEICCQARVTLAKEMVKFYPYFQLLSVGKL